MVGARAHSSETTNTDPTPTLASAPGGLSARRVERWLDLPPGAWHRRRLFALHLRGSSFGYLGLRQGDYLIVEPGAREQPGSIVVTRSSSGTSLRRIPLPAPVEHRMPTVLELPLREKAPSTNTRVVGSVLGVLRETGTGALRPASLSASRSAARRRAPGSGARLTPPPQREASRAPVSLDYVFDMHARWKNWIHLRRAAETATATPSQLERWERLDSSLSTLCDCLRRTHSPGLREALAAEAAAVVSAIHSEMGG
jgi:hypothetical protein